MKPKALLWIFLIVLFAKATVAQKETTDLILNKPDRFYWFFVTLKMQKNPQTKLNEYQVRLSGGIYYGDIVKFKKALWGNRTSLRLAMGPFWNKSTARQAQKIYSQVSRSNPDVSVLNAVNDDMVHWYYLKVQKKRSGYKLEPTFARVASGTVQEFWDALSEGLVQEMLAVGPFNDYNEAEDSKALYRAQEDLRSRR